MLDLEFHVSTGNTSEFEARSALPEGIKLEVTGQCESEPDGRMCYVFRMRHEYGKSNIKYFRGYLDGSSLQGKWGTTPDHLANPFVFKSVTPWIMCCWPSPADLERNKARALWKFAIMAVRHDVLARLFPWKALQMRRENRKKYLSLLQSGPKSQEAALAEVTRSMTVADARCYYWMADYLRRTNPRHL